MKASCFFPVCDTAKSISHFYSVQPNLGEATESVVVVFMESPNIFYCQLAEAIPILDDLIEGETRKYLHR